MSPLLLPLLPLGTAALLVLLRRRSNALGPLAVTGLLATAALAWWAALLEPAMRIAWSPAFDLSVAVNGFGRVMVVLVPLVATPIVAYAAATEDRARTRLLALLLVFVAAMLLLVIAADFVTLLIGWELVGATSWALIGHVWRDSANGRAATQAFLTTRLGDLGLYAAAGATLAATGSFGFEGVGVAGAPWRDLIAAGVLLAVVAKSAQVPFSPWLFAAMAGPTPVSALLHSATLVAAGAYLLIRLAPAMAPVPWFLPAVALFGIVTALAGGVLAVVGTQAKRVLAASTSAQYGLMFVAIGAGSTAAAGAQLVTHAAFKSLLFLVAGVAIHAAGTSDLGRFRLGRALPGVALMGVVGAFALAGVPPIGGAWSKEAILSSAVEASGLLAATALGASLLGTVYAGRFAVLVLGRGEPGRAIRRPSNVELGALAALVIATLLLSMLWLPAAAPLVEALTGGELVGGRPWEFAAALATLVAGGVLVWVLHRRRRLLDVFVPERSRAVVEDWLGLSRLSHLAVVRPTLELAAALARADDRLIDAGVRATGRVARHVSGLAALRLDVSIEAVVRAFATATMATAQVSRDADDRGVDGAVEATGRGIGLAGHQSRRLQTGLSHQYFVIGAVGLVAIAAILAVGR